LATLADIGHVVANREWLEKAFTADVPDDFMQVLRHGAPAR
jgi:hypothetical protein